MPPGILLPGEPVTQIVDVETPTFNDPPPRGALYVRGGGKTGFTAVPFTWSAGDGNLSARIPASALAGDVLDEYAVVRDPGSGASLTVPSAGADRPYRSWIVARARVVTLPKHRFGHTRGPDAIVARARAGDGAGNVGFSQPGEDFVEGPTSFGIAPDGTVWVLDEVHERLLGWDPGRPGHPSRIVPLDFGAGDLAVGPDGTIYVSGSKVGDDNLHMRLYAFTPAGHLLWMGRLLTDIFNAQVRVGPDGIVYAVDTSWVPATDSSGAPLRVADQVPLAWPYQPLAGREQMVLVSTPATCRPCPGTPAEARVGLVHPSGSVDRVWRVLSGNNSDEFDIEALQTKPAVIDGDPVIVFAVYDFDRHLMEHQIVVLSPSGIAQRFSLDRGWWRGSEVVTGIVVGPDGSLYQLQTDPSFGLRIARYSLEAASSPSPSPTATPSTGPSPTHSSGAATASSQGGGPTSLLWLTLGVAGAALVGVPAFILFRRRVSRPAPSGGAG